MVSFCSSFVPIVVGRAMAWIVVVVILGLSARIATAQMPVPSLFNGMNTTLPTPLNDTTSNLGMFDSTVLTLTGSTPGVGPNGIDINFWRKYVDPTGGDILPYSQLYAAEGVSIITYSSVVALEQTIIRAGIATDHTLTEFISAGAISVLRPIQTQCTPVPNAPLQPCSGVMVDEVSFILFDPSDPDPNRVWKVFTHNWFLDTEFGISIHFQWGYISLYTAPTLTGGVWSRESLLGWTDNVIEGIPLSHVGVKQNMSDIPQLKDCFVFSEPSAVMTSDGTTYLALGCVYLYSNGTVHEGRIQIVLLSSVDHSLTYQYVGVLLTAEDALNLGFPLAQFNGGNLFVIRSADAGTETDQIYLLASPSGPVHRNDNTTSDGYVGCVVVHVTDISTATIERNATSGVPVVYRYINSPWSPTEGCGSCNCGACTYAGTASVSYVSNWLQMPVTPWWQLTRVPFVAP